MSSVVAPNNSGKSTYAAAHPRWIDHDVLLLHELGMGQKGAMTKADMLAADGVTRAHKRTGDRMLVATWWDITLVDAFVIVPDAVMQKRLADGKLTAQQYADCRQQARKYRQMAADNDTLVLTSFAAADALFGKLQ